MGNQSVVGRSDATFIGLAIGAGSLLVYLGRSLTFLHDEWRSIGFHGNAVDFLRPVNEHWSTFPLVLYTATFDLVELRSYLPYIAQVVLLHLVAVAGAYALMRRRLGSLWATILAVPLLLLGAGSENLFWAFQTGFVGSVMFGVWALAQVESTKRFGALTASALLVGAIVSSGIGLFFLAALAGRTLLNAPLRSRAWCLVLPGSLYLLWYAFLGRDAVTSPNSLADASAAAEFALRGVAHSSAATSGAVLLPLDHWVGLGLFLAVTAVATSQLLRGCDRGLAAGCLLSLGAMYATIGLIRAHLGVDFATQSRYVYVAAFLLVLGVADLLPRELLWPSTSVRRPARTVALLFVVGCSTVANVEALVSTRNEFQYAADRTRAFIDISVTRSNEPWVDRSARLGLTPAISEFGSIVQKFGSPLQDSIIPAVATPPGPRAYEDALLTAAGNRFRVELARDGGSPLRVRAVKALDVDIVEVGMSCLEVRGTGDHPFFTVPASAGARLRIASSSIQHGSARLGQRFPPTRSIDLTVRPRSVVDVVVPDGSARIRRWKVGFELSRGFGVVTLCALRGARQD